MKLLTIAVPCYQSHAFMDKCIQSLLHYPEDVEVILVDDGSTDETGALADAYQQSYPGVVRAIHQANGGHGAAVMTGIRHANGAYFKVVDSDDWLNVEALGQVLEVLRTFVGLPEVLETPDMVLCNFIYDKVTVKHHKVMRYKNVLTPNRLISWDEVKSFHLGQYILMHSVIYRTQLLRNCDLALPSHTFYVDNLYVYLPMQYVQRIYYLDVNLYHYFIGREGQSVNERIMIGRINQQILVNKLMLEKVDLQAVQSPGLQRYMRSYVEIVTVVSTILLYREGGVESLKKKKELWTYISHHAPSFYRYLTHQSIMGFILKREGWVWHKISLAIYHISRLIVGFS